MVDFKEVAEKDSDVDLNLPDQILHELQDRFSIGRFFILLAQVAIICVAPAALYSYEEWNITMLMNQQIETKNQLDNHKKELTTLKAKLAKYSGDHLKETEFKNKMDILKKLAEQRIVVIRVLDTIHSATFNSAKKNSNQEFIFFNNVSIYGKKININGSASSEAIINSFVQKLQQEPVYKSIQWEDVKSDQQGRIKNFRVSGQLFVES